MRTSEDTTSETKLQGARVIQTDDMSCAAGSLISLNSGPCFAPPKKQNNDLAGAIHIESNRVECIANKEAITKVMKGLDSKTPAVRCNTIHLLASAIHKKRDLVECIANKDAIAKVMIGLDSERQYKDATIYFLFGAISINKDLVEHIANKEAITKVMIGLDSESPGRVDNTIHLLASAIHKKRDLVECVANKEAITKVRKGLDSESPEVRCNTIYLLACAILKNGNLLEHIANKEAIAKVMIGLDSKRPLGVQSCTMFVLEQLSKKSQVSQNEIVKRLASPEKLKVILDFYTKADSNNQRRALFFISEIKNYQKALFNQGMKLLEQAQKNLHDAHEISKALDDKATYLNGRMSDENMGPPSKKARIEIKDLGTL